MLHLIPVKRKYVSLVFSSAGKTVIKTVRDDEVQLYVKEYKAKGYTVDFDVDEEKFCGQN